MRRWNKVLAMLLAIVMVTAMLPISAFAESWAKVEASKREDSSVLTVTVDADQLTALIKSGELFTKASEGLLSSIDLDFESFMNIFTPEELLEIIPQDVLLEHFDAAALAEDVDPQKIMDYIEDYAALLEGCDLTKLPGFLPDETDLSKIFAFSVLMNYVGFEDARGYLLDEKIKVLLNERLKTDGVVEAFVEDLRENEVALSDVINFSKLLSEGVLSLNTGAVSTDAIKDSGLINFNDPELAEKLIKADVLDLAGLETFIKGLSNAKDYFETSKVLLLLNINNYIDDFDYTNFDIDFDVFNETHLNTSELVEEDYTVDPVTGAFSLTEVGKNKIAGDLERYLTDEGMALLESQVSLEDVYPLIDVERLIADVGIKPLAECLIIDRAIRIDGINNYISYTKLIEFVGGIDAILANPNITIDYAQLDLSGLQGVADVTAYVYSNKLLDANVVPRKILFAAAGGEGRLLDCVDTTALFNNSELLNKVISAINADKNVEMTDVVNVSNFVNAVTDKAALVEFIGIDKIRKQIDNDELKEIIETVDDIFTYVTDTEALIRDFISELYWVIDLLSVDGTVVAEENPDTATLKVDAEALAKTLLRLIPTLEEIAALEGNAIISTEIGLQYQSEEATQATQKTIALEVVLEGDIDALKTAAGKLDALLRKYFDLKIESNGDIALGIHLPEIATPAQLATVYRELLDKAALSDETAEKLLGFADAEFAGFIESLTIEDVADILGAVNVNKLYDAFVSISYVQTVLEKLEGKTGVSLGDLTLDEMKDTLLTLPSAERICEILEEKTGRDVRAILDGAADRFEGLTENAAIEKMLRLVEEKLNYDLSDVSVSDILDRAGDESISQKIANVVSDKIGKDVLSILESHTAEELYDLAVEKATESESRFEKVKGYVLKALEYLPESVSELRIADWYRGNGDFGGDVTFDVNYKSTLEKIARKVISSVNPDMSEDAIASILNRIPDGTLSCTVDVSNLHVTDVYQITYMDRAGENVLLRAYLPAGADLTVFKNQNADWLGYTFTGWADENGVEIDVMPKKDVTVYADLASVEVKFYDTNEEFLTQIYVPAGQKIDAELVAQIEALVTLHDVDSHVHESFHILWRGEDVTELVLSGATFTKDTTLYAYLEPDYYMEIEGDYDFDVSFSDGVMSLVVQDKTFEEVEDASFRLSRDNVLYKFLTDTHGYETIRIGFEDDGTGEKLDVFEMDKAMVRQIVNATRQNDEVFLEYRRLTADEIENPMYRGLEDAIFYDFNINVLRGGEEQRQQLDLGLFIGAMTIRLPYEDVVVNAADGIRRTTVHVLGEDTREYIDSIPSTGRIGFKAPHFSQFAVTNEYTVTQRFLFVGTDQPVPGNCYLDGVTATYPNGATFALNPVFDSRYELDHIEVSGATLSQDQKSVTLPEEGGAVTVTVYLKEMEANVLYFVNGELYQRLSYRDKQAFVPLDINEAIEDATVKAPKGYTKVGAAWAGYDETKLGIADLYVFAVWKPIEYTVNFVSEQANATIPYTFTIESYESILPPAVPTVAGMKGAWEPYDLSTVFDGTETTVTVKAVYTPVSYPVLVRYENGENDALLQAIPGQTVSVPKILLDHYTAKVTAVDAEGNEIPVVDWTLTMPTSAVSVTVVYEPELLTYTVNGVRNTGYYNETAIIVIPITAGETLVSISDGCTYVGRVDGEDGKSILKYCFLLTSADCAIEYTVKAVNEPTENVLNGNLYTDPEAPVSEQDNVEFAGWATGVGGLNFATFRYNEQTSLLWLWILLAILILLALITLIYLLHVSGRMKKNLLTRIAVAIVKAFFKLCLGVCAVGLKILGWFGIGKSLLDCLPAPIEEKKTPVEKEPAKEPEKRPQATQKQPQQPQKRKHSKKKKKGGTKQGRKWKQSGKRKKMRKRKSGKR